MFGEEKSPFPNLVFSSVYKFASATGFGAALLNGKF
jgi:hypothetical protein